MEPKRAMPNDGWALGEEEGPGGEPRLVGRGFPAFPHVETESAKRESAVLLLEAATCENFLLQ